MELWDLFDKNRNSLNKTMVRGAIIPPNCYKITVYICIFNDNNEMLICQRTANKATYPNYWDFSAAGSAISGETSEQAIKRELKEEIGIDLYNENLTPKLTIYSEDAFNDIYTYKMNVALTDLVFQKEEVKNAKWATKQEIINMIKNDTFIPFRANLIELLFDMKVSRGMKKK